WAIFLAEYIHVTPPLPDGLLDRAAACRIPGGNVIYKRSALQKASMADHMWELDYHAALYNTGASFYRDSTIAIEYGHPPTIREYVAERFALSRGFAARQAADLPAFHRWILAGSRLALPAVVIARTAAAMLRKRVYIGRFFVTLPWTALFSLVQAAGEIAGFA